MGYVKIRTTEKNGEVTFSQWDDVAPRNQPTLSWMPWSRPSPSPSPSTTTSMRNDSSCASSSARPASI